MVKNKDKNRLIKSLRKKRIGNIPLSQVLIKIGLVISLIIIVPLMFPGGRSFKYSDLTVGSIANKKVIAPFNFPVLKTDKELQQERAAAESEVAYFFNKDDTIYQSQKQKLKQLVAFISQLPNDNSQINQLATVPVKSDSTQPAGQGESQIRQILSDRFDLPLTNIDVSSLFSMLNSEDNKIVHDKLFSVYESLKNYLYIDIPINQIKNEKAILIKNGIEENLPFNSLYDKTAISEAVKNKLTDSDHDKIIARLLNGILKPNTIYNQSVTQQRRKEAVAAVSTGKDLVYENERIVDANERITEDIYQKLISLEIAIAEKSTEQGDWRNFLAYLGRYLLTALILLLYAIYLSANRPKVFKDNKKLLLITVIILLQVGVGALIVGPLGWPSYLVPTTISSMLLGILFDPGIGFVGTVVIGLILAGITGFDYTFAILTMFVGLVAIYSVTHIRTRNQIFRAIFYILSAYIIVVFTLGTLKYQAFDEMFQIFLYYLLPNAILSPFITYMMLGVFERLFDITTDVTLLELSDLNHPLLKELSVKAPGTFHHSIIVGNLSEAAAISIGANSLLARVGSYYHDIGKMIKPEYFVENQKDIANKHEGLAPNMSAIILASHVKNGIEMAEKNKLPKIIRDFIPEHHGKNLMSFFYNKAIESKDSKEVNEADYRYPGPSPQSKETAIVMLADTVEAATRTLSNPSAGRLRKQVEELVEKRFLEGELDDSDLTMRDLKGIIDGFMSVLLGIYHQRIEYPKSQDSSKTTNKGVSKKKGTVAVETNGNSNPQSAG